MKNTIEFIRKNLLPIAVSALMVSSLVGTGLTALVFMGGGNGGNNDQILGAAPFRPSGISINIREDLVAGSSRSGTTLVIDPIITADGHRVAMSDIGDIGFAKLDQGTDNEEIISFTGITDNTTTYTLSGVKWGYNFYNDTSGVAANQKRHVAGGTFIITNDDHFLFEQYVNKDGDQTITGDKITTGQYTFSSTSIPKLDGTVNPTLDAEFAIKAYVDSVATSGAPDATETVKGVVELATQDEMASSTVTGGTSANMCLRSKYATSTPTLTGKYIPVSESDGKLNQSWYDLTEAYAWSGNNTHSGTNTFSATTTMSDVVLTATSTKGNSVQSKAYIDKYVSVGYGVITGDTATSTTEFVLPDTISIPANAFGNNGGLRIKTTISQGGAGTYETFVLRVKLNGTNIMSISTPYDGNGSQFSGNIDAVWMNNGTTNSQSWNSSKPATYGTSASFSSKSTGTYGSSSFDTTVAMTLSVGITCNNVSCNTMVSDITVEYIPSR